MLDSNPFRRFLAVSAASLFVLNIAAAQQNSGLSDKKPAMADLPEVAFFPNPAKTGNMVTIKLAEAGTEKFEAETFSVKITDERGQVLFSAELPDELEFTPSSDRFPKGNYFLQYFENGRLFQTEELRIE